MEPLFFSRYIRCLTDRDYYDARSDSNVLEALYNDPKNLARQEQKDIEMASLTPILDADQAVSQAAARSSVLTRPEVIRKLLNVAKTCEDEKSFSSLSQLTVRSLQSSITRGYLNLLRTLKMEFIESLKR